MTALVLHLSDIHIKTSQDLILQNGKKIAASVFRFLPRASHIFIIVSGDIAYSGLKEEYALATTFLSSIRDELQKETETPIDFLVVPGNHDCNFKKNTATRNLLLASLDARMNIDVDESIIDNCTSIQNDFFDFRDNLENHPDATDDRLWRTNTFEVEGKVLVFECLNMSWMSRIKEDPGRLYFPIDLYKDKSNHNADVRCVVIHHPPNWLNQVIYREFRIFIRRLANIIFSGHEHQGNVGQISEAETDKSVFVEGCALQGAENLTDSAFNIIVLDLGREQFQSTRFGWDDTRYVDREEGSWSDYHDLPAKRTNPFAIAHSFLETLEDPGAFFKHPGQGNIGLTDIYIYPDLLHANNGDGQRRIFINAKKILSPNAMAGGVVIEAEEKAGKTSLLYQIFRRYHEMGFVPIFIDGKDFRTVSGHEIETSIKSSLKYQYEKPDIVTFDQLPRDKKILLVDNFDDCRVKSTGARVELLRIIRERFGHFIITVGDTFDLREILEGETYPVLASTERYKLQPFGHVLRGKLIARWLSLAEDGTTDNAALIGRRDQAEKLMNSVMQKGIIPAAPLYLLTLLQSIDAGRSGDFKDSALGYYYQYLLTEALQRSGVRPDKLTEYFQYLAHMAWEFHTYKKTELSRIELRDFNERFSRKWHTVEFESRLNTLLRARILCMAGDDFSFRYPYIFYYLKGQYLSENLHDAKNRAYIEHCCEHLYVRDYANTVLFLGHHSNDDFVLNSIAVSLNAIFDKQKPIRFSGDTKAIATFIADAPELTYSGGTPLEHRDKRNEVADVMDDGSDGLLESEEDAAELSIFAKLTTLFKTSEILGQIIKNQYSRIQRDRKVDLLEGLFSGPLRALSFYYDLFVKNPDALVAVMEEAIERKGNIQDNNKRKDIARKAVSSLLEIVTFGFIIKASQSANSESLIEEIHKVVEKDGSPAFNLIELGILLDSPTSIPKVKIRSLHQQIKNDMIANRVMRIMILNHLYMFVTSEKEMQWLQAELNISLVIQHSITYQENRAKVVS